MIVSRKSLLKRGTAMFFPGARKCKYSAILISEGILDKKEMSQEKDTTCPEAGVKFRKKKKTIMLPFWFSGTEEDTLAVDDDFEEEEMLKRAIAMSLEEH